MSDHEEHGHTLLWLCVMILFMHSCTTGVDRLNTKVNDLSVRVRECEDNSEIQGLKRQVNDLNARLQKYEEER